MFRSTRIMWSPNYIYIPIQGNCVFSKLYSCFNAVKLCCLNLSPLHNYCYCLLSVCWTAAKEVFYCSRAFLCFVSLTVIAVQRILSDSSVVRTEIKITYLLWFQALFSSGWNLIALLNWLIDSFFLTNLHKTRQLYRNWCWYVLCPN